MEWEYAYLHPCGYVVSSYPFPLGHCGEPAVAHVWLRGQWNPLDELYVCEEHLDLLLHVSRCPSGSLDP